MYSNKQLYGKINVLSRKTENEKARQPGNNFG